MRVLGVDPGLTRCGLAVVDGGSARQASLVAVGTARSPSDAGLDTRLLQLDIALGRWLELYRPDVVAVERVFSQQNVRTVMGTAQVAGIAVLAAARRGIPVCQHTPSEVKAAVTGSGRAGKRQVAVMVTRILGLSETPRPADASDAVALALCHLWRGGALASLRVQDAAGTPPPGPGGIPGAGARTDAQQQWDRAAAEASRPDAVPARLAGLVARSRSARPR